MTFPEITGCFPYHPVSRLAAPYLIECAPYGNLEELLLRVQEEVTLLLASHETQS